MAVEVLRPQDVLADRFRVHTTPFHRRRVFPENSNLVVNRKQHRKTSPPKPEKRRSNASAPEARRSSHVDPRRKADAAASASGAGLVMGQVTLLRRGEPLSSKTSAAKPSGPIRNPIGDPSVPKQIRLIPAVPADIYAGSAFSMSPSPRSVPLPSFFNKVSNDGATRDLRRLLRLE